ncbi:putative peptidoglycan binding protein [Shimia isoporae]|uniref:Putative peptidoglycan binding protein n=1 Tax=Shimia isoporae TaxID=647720 RepID=A0A4R1NMK5_9RHOB|nr:holin-associated N-acetylmuramidase [Shimia isoporae]TCL09666.1 putative peptidoglycan binding protein [Shimia isoporae]
MLDVRAVAREIVAREGGFVNDPDDPGGATKHGVTLATARALGLDKDGDGDVDVADIRGLTRRDAEAVFLEHYYAKPGISHLPEALQATVFDMYVNAGGNAVKILQRLLGHMGQAVAVDGQIGPETIEAAKAAATVSPSHLKDAYGIARRNYYLKLADARPSLRKFARTRSGGKGGWIKRAEEFISTRYHLSEAEFGRRISKWG